VIEGSPAQVRSMALEIIGPPGSGKSALMEALQAAEPDIVPVSIYWRKPENVSAGVRSALSIAAILFERGPHRVLSVQQVVWMIRLEAALPILHRKNVTPPAIVAFDQGPLYTMVRLEDVASGAPEGSRLRLWWERKLNEWAKVLDLLVFLDAPNEVLIDRIRKRSKAHVAKDQPEQNAAELIGNERAAYMRLADSLRQRGEMSVLRLDTSSKVVDDLSHATLEAISNVKSIDKRV
jgi:hypothetical protein